jgi:DNA-binding XRE family transcriptional regulator
MNKSERLKQRRQELGFTLKEVAHFLGVTIGAIHHLEKHPEAMPSLELGLNLARMYRRSPKWILYGVDEGALQGVPLVGNTKTGPGEWKPGNTGEDVPCIAYQSPYRSSYALRIEETYGFSEYREGDVLLLDAAMSLIPGEDVLIGNKDGSVSILRLSRIVDDSYYFDDAQNKRTRVGKDDINYVHQIVGTIKSFATEE